MCHQWHSGEGRWEVATAVVQLGVVLVGGVLGMLTLNRSSVIYDHSKWKDQCLGKSKGKQDEGPFMKCKWNLKTQIAYISTNSCLVA